jgi:hypothetical protein
MYHTDRSREVVVYGSNADKQKNVETTTDQHQKSDSGTCGLLNFT